MNINDISEQIIDAAMKVHTTLGPGLLERPYHEFLKQELLIRGTRVLSELTLPATYNGSTIDLGYRVDLLVEDQVIVEIKAVTEITSLHKAQMLTYLKLSKKPLGLLINFNTLRLKYGIARIINSSCVRNYQIIRSHGPI